MTMLTIRIDDPNTDNRDPAMKDYKKCPRVVGNDDADIDTCPITVAVLLRTRNSGPAVRSRKGGLKTILCWWHPLIPSLKAPK
jgi:hypothetical protein